MFQGLRKKAEKKNVARPEKKKPKKKNVSRSKSVFSDRL